MTEANVNPCGSCGQPAERGHLCAICDSATIRSLLMLAPIVADLRSMMVNIQAVQHDSVRVDSSREPKLIVDFDLADRANALYATVGNWAVGWALALGKAGPAHLASRSADTVVVRLPSGLASFTAASGLSNWLISNHDEIALHEDAPAYVLDVMEAINGEALAVGYRPRVQRVPQKRCRDCDSATLRMRWNVGGTPKLFCTACGGEWECGPKLSRSVLTTR